jgi:hypothetical protein
MWYVKLSDVSLAILAKMRHNLSTNAVKVEGAEEDGCSQEPLHTSTGIGT